MKKFFKGFTLAELLLCLGIIGIVTALGMTVANKSTERAYNMYWKVGYENLYNTLAEMQNKESGLFNKSNNERNQIAKFLNNIFNDKDEIPNQGEADEGVVKTKNGIKYEIPDGGVDGSGSFIVKMTVPQPKTRKNPEGEASTYFLATNQGNGYLIPLNPEDLGVSGVNLQERVDLLPFYVDDGTVGRVMNNDGNRRKYTPVTKQSFQNAACNAYGSIAINVPDLSPAVAYSNLLKFGFHHMYSEILELEECVTIKEKESFQGYAPTYGDSETCDFPLCCRDCSCQPGSANAAKCEGCAGKLEKPNGELIPECCDTCSCEKESDKAWCTGCSNGGEPACCSSLNCKDCTEGEKALCTSCKEANVNLTGCWNIETKFNGNLKNILGCTLEQLSNSKCSNNKTSVTVKLFRGK